jgi:hypothetical protein
VDNKVPPLLQGSLAAILTLCFVASFRPMIVAGEEQWEPHLPARTKKVFGDLEQVLTPHLLTGFTMGCSECINGIKSSPFNKRHQVVFTTTMDVSCHFQG